MSIVDDRCGLRVVKRLEFREECMGSGCGQADVEDDVGRYQKFTVKAKKYLYFGKA